jgi:hypothetical protein
MLAADPWQEIDGLQLQSYAYRQSQEVAEKYHVISKNGIHILLDFALFLR